MLIMKLKEKGKSAVKWLKGLGAERVVLPRELSIDEIKDLKGTDIEIESFVHGALCYCYSGQCLLSSFIGGRSGNRGRCAQPCRLPYDVLAQMCSTRQMAVCLRQHLLVMRALYQYREPTLKPLR